MKENSHHNSTGEQGEQLDMFEKKANKQEEIVLALFKRNPRMTASDCFRMYPDRDVPITSIRRAITNLTGSGKLYKTNEKKKGIYGRPEYFYEFNLNH